MPYQDQTGPRGLGPQTGRRLGPCARGPMYNRGQGLRQKPTPDMQILEEEEQLLQGALNRVREEKERIHNKK